MGSNPDSTPRRGRKVSEAELPERPYLPRVLLTVTLSS